MLITRGFVSNTIITLGFGQTVEIEERWREVIYLKSPITFIIRCKSLI